MNTHRAQTSALATAFRLKDFVQAEPVVTSMVLALVAGIIGVVVSFGAPITPEQADAIQTAIVPLMGLIFLVARGFVTPNSKVAESVEKGLVVAGPANELPTGTTIRVHGKTAEGEDVAPLED